VQALRNDVGGRRDSQAEEKQVERDTATRKTIRQVQGGWGAPRGDDVPITFRPENASVFEADEIGKMLMRLRFSGSVVTTVFSQLPKVTPPSVICREAITFA
jgi:hypothetical protein